MSSLPLSPRIPAAADRRLAGLLATVLVHAALVLGWQLARTPAPAPEETDSPMMQWIALPPPAAEPTSAPARPPVAASRPQGPAEARGARPARSTPSAAAPSAAMETATPVAEQAGAPAADQPAGPTAASILDEARRSVGRIDRALRKENKPLIVAPPDSPELRMRRGMEQAHALAPPRLWEAPKVEELVNNTGDGARRTRVISGRRTYCITERSPATNVEMIEMHGKIRLTNCPAPEEPAKRQEWRTARD